MAENIKTLTPATAAPVPEVVEILRNALAMAEDGNLREVVIAGTTSGHGFYRAFKAQDTVILAGLLALGLGMLSHTMETKD